VKTLVSLIAGLFFGLGLCLSGMTEPRKVQGFLDIAGLWDPSLALVMGGAVGVGMIAFRLAAHHKRSLLGEPLQPPAAIEIDAPLLMGSVIFGIGWGLSGICPGPAVVNLSFFDPRAIAFFVAMLAGMALHRGFFSILRPHHLASIEQDG